MLEKYNRYKLLKIFIDSPTESFRLREVSRLAKISPPSVMSYLKEFEEEDLIKKQVKRGIPFYSALRDKMKFVLYKKISIIFELNKSGLIDYLWDNVAPKAIILYGSFSKGESIENSDIDLFVLGKEKPISIENFEKILKREVHIISEDSLNKLPKELRNNILNGIILRGYVKVF
ncbi:nucleotidyltransferase domain-containing protein [Candidatus Pacearchaeota archaeon]|nr:nucleotidyltransferase domain-containing protein [Candidatus Pacearchaeota archaeon]